MGHYRRYLRQFPLVIVLTLMLGVARLSLADTVRLNCQDQPSQGPSTLMEALEIAQPGDTIAVRGACPQTQATLTKDDLTLMGSDIEQAVFTGTDTSEPVLTIDGARRIVIQNIVTQGGSTGLLVTQGATATLENVSARDNREYGIRIDRGSTAQLRDCMAQGNGDDGFAVLRNANATLSGSIVSRENGDDGIQFGLGASGTIKEAVISANNNGNSPLFGSDMFEGGAIGDGIRLTVSANVIVIGSTIETVGNANDGLAVARASAFTAFAAADSSFAAEPVSISTSENGQDGIDVTGNSLVNTAGSLVTWVLRNNTRRALNLSIDSTFSLPRATILCEESTGQSTCPP